MCEEKLVKEETWLCQYQRSLFQKTGAEGIKHQHTWEKNKANVAAVHGKAIGNIKQLPLCYLDYLGTLAVAGTQYMLIEWDLNKQSLTEVFKCKLLCDA